MIIGNTPDFWEHETFLTAIDSGDIYSPEDAVEKIRGFIESPKSNVGHYEDALEFLRKNWGVELLKYIYFPEDENNEFQKKYDNDEELVDDAYTYKEVLDEIEGLNAQSYYTLIDISDESGIYNDTEITTPSGDVVCVFDSVIMC